MIHAYPRWPCSITTMITTTTPRPLHWSLLLGTAIAITLFLYFIDEGPGLPPDQLEKIFEPYYRLSNDTPGTGLGLGIARSIAHAHGGDLVLENRPQGGLQAVLSLPRH